MSDILDKVSDKAIYERFAPDFPKQVCKSPFRTDKTPSFGFYKKGDMWHWKDLGGNGDSGDVFDYVARLERTDIAGAIQKIAEAFAITTAYSTPIIVGRKFNSGAADMANQRGRSLIQVIRRPFEQWEAGWWNRMLIHPGLREFYFIRAASEVWVDKKLYWVSKPDNPAYYWINPVSQNIKCYRPFEENKKRKWLSNQDPNRDVQGYWQCQITRNVGLPLLLVKSMKEVAFFRAWGFQAMANTAEHTYYNPDFIRHIRKYCGPIMYLGDNDWPGMRACVKLIQKHQIPSIIIPRKWGSKDPTDLWLANYRKVYDLLNFIHDYFKRIRYAGPGVIPSRGIYHPGEAA